MKARPQAENGDEMKFISWNVNGLRAAVGKGFFDFFHEVDADIFCVQETKLQEGLKRLEYRMRWEDDFLAYIKKLDKKKPVIYCGDLNVAHEEIDLKNPKTNHMNAGFTDEERGKLSKVLASGFTDSFRYLYPDTTDAYSWWSDRMKARERNAGWRIDYFIVSDKLRDRIAGAGICDSVYGSDHCPVELTWK